MRWTGTGSDRTPTLRSPSRFVDLRSRESDRRVAADGAFFGESPVVVQRLIGNGVELEALIVTERRRSLLESIDTANADVAIMAENDLYDLVGFEMHRGVIGIFTRPTPPPAEVATLRVVGLLEGINDADNLGALTRCAAALGVGALILDRTTADPFSRRAVRVSMGAVGAVRIITEDNWPPRFDQRRLIALTPSGDVPLTEVSPIGLTAIAIGAEGLGLTTETLDASDLRVRIDMERGLDSLNVAQAAAIAFHHFRRNRTHD